MRLGRFARRVRCARDASVRSACRARALRAASARNRFGCRICSTNTENSCARSSSSRPAMTSSSGQHRLVAGRNACRRPARCARAAPCGYCRPCAPLCAIAQTPGPDGFSRLHRLEGQRHAIDEIDRRRDNWGRAVRCRLARHRGHFVSACVRRFAAVRQNPRQRPPRRRRRAARRLRSHLRPPAPGSPARPRRRPSAGRRCVATQGAALDLVAGAADEMKIAAKAETLDIVEHIAAERERLRRGADNRERPRPQQTLERAASGAPDGALVIAR